MRKKKQQFWYPQGPFVPRYTRRRWKRLRATYTDGELRSRFKDYPGPRQDKRP
jgi:hypothetical protein